MLGLLDPQENWLQQVVVAEWLKTTFEAIGVEPLGFQKKRKKKMIADS